MDKIKSWYEGVQRLGTWEIPREASILTKMSKEASLLKKFKKVM